MPADDEKLEPPASAASDPLLGTAYRARAALGRGGMGEVLLAEHRRLGKTVVVKLLHQELATPAAAERLRVEAQVLAKISHPNLVEVFDLGITGEGRPFLVMERLLGRTLREEIHARGALPVAESVDVALAVLSALHAAHSAGIVHRDVKSENVFITTNSQRPGSSTVKLLDFGVAKVLASDPTVAPSRFGTEEGSLLGTPRFCSPEQALGRADVDHRADIYSVGVLLFFMIVGRRPFEQANMVELLNAHVSEPPPAPSSVAPQPVPDGVERVLLRALAKRPEDRFQSAEEMSAALRAAFAGSQTTTEPLPALPRSGAAAPPTRPASATIAHLRPRAAPPSPSPREPDRSPPRGFDRGRFALTFVAAALILGCLVTFALRAILAGR